MYKIIFYIISLLGFITIIISSFVIPNNPFEIIPSYNLITIDRPLWLNIVISCSFFYILIINYIYDIFLS